MTSVRTGLFVDLDGTLANNLPIMRQVYERFLARYGHEGSDSEFHALNGPPLTEVVGILVRTHDLPDTVGTAFDKYSALLNEAYRAARPNDGAENLLRQARRLGMRVAVVTSAEAGLATEWLGHVGLGQYVDAIVGAGDAVCGKPDPAPYQLALARTDCQAAGSVAVEDSHAGCRAALAAGLRTFMLASPSQNPPEGSIVIDSLTEMADILTRRDDSGRGRE